MRSERLEAITLKFRRSLPGKADEIERALANASEVVGDPQLILLVHKLAGAAGFYGLESIATLASALERDLDPKRESAGDVGSIDENITTLLEAMRAGI